MPGAQFFHRLQDSFGIGCVGESEEMIKHPITGEVSKARTRHVVKGGEDSVGDKLSLLRVYLNIGLCLIFSLK